MVWQEWKYFCTIFYCRIIKKSSDVMLNFYTQPLIIFNTLVTFSVFLKMSFVSCAWTIFQVWLRVWILYFHNMFCLYHADHLAQRFNGYCYASIWKKMTRTWAFKWSNRSFLDYFHAWRTYTVSTTWKTGKHVHHYICISHNKRLFIGLVSHTFSHFWQPR